VRWQLLPAEREGSPALFGTSAGLLDVAVTTSDENVVSASPTIT